MRRSSKLLMLVTALGGLLSYACASRESELQGTGGAQGSGGTAAGSGGTAAGSAGLVSSGGASATGGAPGKGGLTSSGGTLAEGGTSGETGGGEMGGGEMGGASGGTSGSATGGASAATGGASTGTGGSGSGDTSTGGGGALGKFSFFVTSLEAMRRLSRSNDGFGGDLRFGETSGLAGADKICATIADVSMPGSSAKGWRAFLSALRASPSEDKIVDAIDRIGEGPWYDRMGRLLAKTKDDLLQTRPRGADPSIINDLPNEYGIPNHNPDGLGQVDNHDVMTGTGPDGKLTESVFGYPTRTCYDWTSSAKEIAPGDVSQTASGPMCGHSWSGNWMGIVVEGGCGAGVNLEETGPPRPGVLTVGTGGGYGAIYCFALQP